MAGAHGRSVRALVSARVSARALGIKKQGSVGKAYGTRKPLFNQRDKLLDGQSLV